LSLIPGWDSIAGAHLWSNVYFWASICALIMLGVFEVVSHRYSERHEELSAIEREATDHAHEIEIAQLHRETAEANRKAEEERLARVKIEEYLAPRVILQDQGERIGAAIKPYAGTPFDIAVDPAVEVEFVRNILDVLGFSGGWK
jgi:hypothetical protein